MKHDNILFYIMDNIRWNIESKEGFANQIYQLFNRTCNGYIGTLRFGYMCTDIQLLLINAGLALVLCDIITEYSNEIQVKYEVQYDDTCPNKRYKKIYQSFDINYDTPYQKCNFKYIIYQNHYYDTINNDILKFNYCNSVLNMNGTTSISDRSSRILVAKRSTIKNSYKNNIYFSHNVITFLNAFTKRNNMKLFDDSNNADDVFCYNGNNKYIMKNQKHQTYIIVNNNKIMKNIVTIMTLINDVMKKYK